MFKVAVSVLCSLLLLGYPSNSSNQIVVCLSPVGDLHGVFSKTNVSKPKLPLGGPHDSAFEDGGFVYLIGRIKVSLCWASLLHDQSYC